ITTEEDFDEHFHNQIWTETAKEVCKRHRISFQQIIRSQTSFDHIVFIIDNSFVLKIYRPYGNGFLREKKAIEFVSGQINFQVPEIIHVGEIESFDYILMNFLSGDLMTREIWLDLPENEQIKIVTQLAQGLKTIHQLNSDSFNCDWAEFVKDRAETFIERQIASGVNAEIIEALPAFIETNLPLVPTKSETVFMHSDIHFGNLRLTKIQQNWEVTGLFDFADSRKGFYEYDFLAICVLIIQGQGNLQREFFKAYGYAEKDLDETMRKRLMMLMMLYESADLRRYAMRLRPEAVDYSLEKLEKEIWSFV
ncbi:MAG: aminoglycoside phosphotransferase family protein, partial [Pyrinomonadaceae bacterium]|nr:aminoglycoside phosphotransferase family protein [Pyrinomonadaceae bacterium]